MTTIHINDDLLALVIGAVLLLMTGLIIATEAAVEGRRKTPHRWGTLDELLKGLVLAFGFFGALMVLGSVVHGFIAGVSG